jgi:NADPH dehydrogenase (quinone)
MFGFHRMNAFTGMEPLKSIHFHDLEKNVTPEKISGYQQRYRAHLKAVFAEQEVLAA